jgi:hypothetical protein
VRSDPTDTGGLFVGRRPGTRPVRYRALPPPGTRRRRAVDRTLAAVLLVTMGIICLLFWGPLPAAWLWLGSQVQYVTDSPTTGLVATFFGLLFTILLGLMVCKRIDGTWVLVRRAAGYDQREGALPKVFGITCALGALAFAAWFLLFAGADLAPLGINAP